MSGYDYKLGSQRWKEHKQNDLKVHFSKHHFLKIGQSLNKGKEKGSRQIMLESGAFQEHLLLNETSKW